MAARYVCVYPANYTYYASEGYSYSAGYPSLNAAFTAEVGTFTDDLYIDILHGDETNNWNGNPDTAAVTADGWDMQGSARIIIRTMTAAGTDADQLGTSSRPDWSDGQMDTTEYVLQVANRCILFDNDATADKYLRVTFRGIQLFSTAVAEVYWQRSSAYHDDIRFEKCWIKKTGGNDDIIDSDCTSGDLLFQNCVIEGPAGSGIDDGVYQEGTQTCRLYNCTIFGVTDQALKQTSGTLVAVNCIVGLNTNDFDGTITGQYNCSDDGDGPGTNVAPLYGADDWTGDLTTPWSNLTVLGTGANIYLGSPISNYDDAYVPIDDIIGTARNTDVGEDVCIGAFEFIVVGGVNVNCTKVDLTLTKYNPTVNAKKEVSVGLKSLTLTTYNPTVGISTNVNVGLVSLTLTKYNPTIKVDINLTTSNVTLTQTTYQSTVNAVKNVQVGLSSLSLTIYQTNINSAIDVESGYSSLTLTTYQATLNVALNIQADYSALTLTTYQANVNLGIGVNVGVVSLTQTIYQSIINSEVDVAVGYSSLTLTIYNATVDLGAVPVNVDCGLISLTLTKYNASVNAKTNVQVGLISLTQAEYAANINSEIDVAVDYDALTLTMHQSEVVFDVFIAVDVDTIILSVYKASVSTGAETYLKRNRGFLLGGIYGKT